jgi:protein O-GlcNAc transferase
MNNELSKAIQYHQSGQIREAEEIYKKILEVYPNHPEALHLLGVIAHQSGRNEAAVDLIGKAIHFSPGNPHYYSNMGAALRAMGKTNEAIAWYQKTLELNPDYAEAHNNMGNAFREMGKFKEAVSCYQKAAQLKPDMLTPYNNMGIALKEQGKLDQAVACYQKALQIKPDHAESYERMGNIFRDQGKISEAVACYERSLQIKPNPGIEVRKLLAIPPINESREHIEAVRKQVFEQLDALEKKGLRLDDPHQQVGTTNFYFAYHGLNDRDLQKRIAEFYIRACPDLACDLRPASNNQQPTTNIQTASNNQHPTSNNQTASNNQIKIGFVSIHLFHSTQQTVGRLNRGIIKNLSRNKFHVTLFRFAGRESQMEKIFEADDMVVLPNDLKAARQQIAERSLDILFYPDIGMDALTYFLGFSRLAAVQCVTSGHPVTTGIPNMDYFISSETLEGPGAEEHYTEQLVRLKRMNAYYYRPEMPDVFLPRAHFNLPDDANLYMCPQAIFKYHPDFDLGLGAILRRDPKGLLVLLEGSYEHFTTLWRNRFLRQFPDMENRIKFLSFMSHKEFLSLLTLADALIDPPYFGGGNTTYESFACGVPIVTWPGPYMRGRVTLALCKQMGVMDCVANDAASYIETALRLANDKDWREEVRRKIRANADVLFEDMEMVRELEEFFEASIPRTTKYTKYTKKDEGAESSQSLLLNSLSTKDSKDTKDTKKDEGAESSQSLLLNSLTTKYTKYTKKEEPESSQSLVLNSLSTKDSKDTKDTKKDEGAEISQSSVLNFQLLQTAIQYQQRGELDKAEAIYKKILEVDPNHGDALHLSGIIAHQSGRKATAVELIQRAIQADPGKACYYNSLGITCQDRGKLDEALSWYQKALEINPNSVETYGNMGFTLQDQGRLDEAVACYQKALQVKPDDPVMYNDMGTALQDMGRVDEAVACYQKALKFRPNYPEAYNNLGNAYKDQKNLDESIRCYKKALELKPDYTKAYCYLVRQLQQTCAWQELESYISRLEALTRKELKSGAKTSESPFMVLARTMDPAYHLEVAKSWSRSIEKLMSHSRQSFSPDFSNRLSKTGFQPATCDLRPATCDLQPATCNPRPATCNKKITLGYLSGDFRNHAVSHLMLGIFGAHNREEFNVFCYSYGRDDGSEYRRRIMQDCDKFIDLNKVSHVESAKRIYEDGVDILIELTGHTKDGRLEICALRPAPIQGIYLGFPGTSGADFFDYIITDKIVTPEEHAPYYTEKFACMPCFQVNDNTQTIADKQWKKADFGLPPDSFVFCSFNHGYKIEPVMFDVWMKILRQVPASILWLPSKSETGERNLRHEAEIRGVNPGRLFFAQRVPTKAEYLARIQLADLALDTRIYNGHTTTSDALWAGVPVITLQGDHYASRVASSALTAVGLPELITHSLEAYEGLAIRLANQPEELRGIRQKLEKNRFTEPLFDTPGFANNLEILYKKMWEIFLAGEKPQHIDTFAGC